MVKRDEGEGVVKRDKGEVRRVMKMGDENSEWTLTMSSIL